MASAWERIGRGFPVTPATAMAVAAMLLVVSGGIGFFTDQQNRNENARQAQVQAEILAGSLGGALAFDDRATAQEYLNALKADPNLEAAAAYNSQGSVAASLHRRGPAPPIHNPVASPRYVQGKLEVGSPVNQGTTRLGSVYLRFSTESLLARLTRYLAVAAIIIMASMLIVVLGASHAGLREAHRRLQQEILEREKAEEALRQSQKMEAMGQLTGGVAHDFNNLLMIASSGLDLMDRTADAARRERLKEGIRQAIDRGASLTQQLLAFARRAPVKPQVIEPRVALEGMMNLLDRSLREDVSVRLEFQPDLWPIEVDPSAFEVAILNMAINARDAMPNGGVITIRAENLPVGDGRETDLVQICITDTGVGLAPELASRVFEPFFTTKGVGHGTGLGLSQVYGFARSSGGDVEFTSELGAGTTVCICIPRSSKALPVPAPDTSEQAGSNRVGRVLLVEDDDTVANLVSEMLVELGYDFFRARDAGSALEALRTDSAFELVFSDMVMPGEMNGLELAEQIASEWPDMPILLTTGYSAAATSAAAKGVRLLVKPYRIEAFARELSAALASKQPSADAKTAP